jgi:hypothetical protein
MVTITILLPLVIAAVALTLCEISNAQIGHEDDNGFECVWVNQSPDRTDVAEVWQVATRRVAGAF